jgi:hypothetical protein
MISESPASKRTFVRILVALSLFGISFGFVEAAVVVYLRQVYFPVVEYFYPAHDPADLFPLLRLDQLGAMGPVHEKLLLVELVREGMTLLMLVGIAVAVARNMREGLAAFVLAFGIWDVAFYGSLKLTLDWPSSLHTWDLLFLLPVPWVGPVLAPLMVAATMIAGGTAVLHRECLGRPVALKLAPLTTIATGGIVIIGAFCCDYRNIMGGGLPNPFHWPLFALGEVVGVFGLLVALTDLQCDDVRKSVRATADEMQLGRVPTT